MKASPIQLLQSTIEKLSVEANPDYVASTAASSEDVPLEVREICEPFPTFWEGQAQSPEGIAERTFFRCSGLHAQDSQWLSACLDRTPVWASDDLWRHA